MLGDDAGGGHSVICTTEGVFVWGNGGDGRLGLGSVKNIVTPTPVPALSGNYFGSSDVYSHCLPTNPNPNPQA